MFYRVNGNNIVSVSVCNLLNVFYFQTLVECVRLRTFGKYGLQQIQVDTHYLQMYLWRFVSDEKYVCFVLFFHFVDMLEICEPSLF